MKRRLAYIVFLVLLLPSEGGAKNCTVSTTPVTFGIYDVFSLTPLLSNGAISIVCEPGVPNLDVAIGVSANSGGFNPRQMLDPGSMELMSYNLYTDSGTTNIWGDGTAGTSIVPVSNNWNQVPTFVLTIYGSIPIGQDLSVGAYSDTLTVTITW